MVRVPLKEEEVFGLFNQSEDNSQEEKMCRCHCNCDEPEPPPRVRNTFSAFFFTFYKQAHSSFFVCFSKKRKARKSNPPQGIWILDVSSVLGNQRFLLRNEETGFPLRFRSWPESRQEEMFGLLQESLLNGQRPIWAQGVCLWRVSVISQLDLFPWLSAAWL